MLSLIVADLENNLSYTEYKEVKDSIAKKRLRESISLKNISKFSYSSLGFFTFSSGNFDNFPAPIGDTSNVIPSLNTVKIIYPFHSFI